MQGVIAEQLTRRRLGGAALVLGGLAVAAVVLLPKIGGGDRAASTPSVRLVSVPQLGLAFAHPRSWKRTVDGRVIRVRSPDGTAVVTLSSPVAGRHSKAVKAALLRGLKQRLKEVSVLREGRGRLGTRTVDSVEVSGFGETRRVRALGLVGSTSYRTYAVTVLTPLHPSEKRLAEVARILATVRLTKPRSVGKRR